MGPGNFEFVILALVGVLLGLVIRAAWLGRRRWRPADWARGMGFELTPQNSSMVVAYLVRTRTLRVARGGHRSAGADRRGLGRQARARGLPDRSRGG